MTPAKSKWRFVMKKIAFKQLIRYRVQLIMSIVLCIGYGFGQEMTPLEHIGWSFLEARGNWDAETAAGLLTEDVDSFDIQGASSLEDYQAAFAYFQILNWNWRPEECSEYEGNVVSCLAELENDLSRAMNKGPFYMLFDFEFEGEKIKGIYPTWSQDYIRRVLNVFRNYIAERSPEDYAIIFTEASPAIPQGEEALSLLRQYADEFMAMQGTSAKLQATQIWTAEFSRIPIAEKMPTGQSVAIECQDEGADYPYSPYDWPEAKASLSIEQTGSQSVVSIEMTGVKPNNYYTMWLRLKGKDTFGNDYGGNPILGIDGTPLIPSSELNEALTFTGAGNAKVGLSNGFWSDENGNAIFMTTLDYPIIGGAFPFQNFEGFDPTDERFPIENPRAIPVAIVTTGAPFTLRVASHCQ